MGCRTADECREESRSQTAKLNTAEFVLSIKITEAYGGLPAGMLHNRIFSFVITGRNTEHI